MFPSYLEKASDFDPTVVPGVPSEAKDFTKVFDPDGVQEFVYFEIVNSREESLFEFNSMGKAYAFADKADDVDPMSVTSSEQRKAKVAKMAEFYAAQESQGTELSFFSDKDVI